MGVLVVHILLVIARRTQLAAGYYPGSNGKTPERQETQTKNYRFQIKRSGDNNIPRSREMTKNKPGLS